MTIQKTLITLRSWNDTKSGEYRNRNEPMPNGIACPSCGEELLDTSPHEVLTSNPPQKNVHCVCGYHGYRVA